MITETGFIPKKSTEILTELQTLSQSPEYWGSDVDLSDYNPLGKLLKLMALTIEQVWELAEDTYYQSFLDTAEGVNLDRLSRLTGITRKPASSETTELTFTGEDYTQIPTGFLIQTKSGIVFETMETVVLQSGTTTVNAKAVNTGLTSRVLANTLTEFVTPIAGLDTVTNAEGSIGGAERETDNELRERIFTTLSVFSQNNSGSIVYMETVLLSEPDIINAFVVENQYSIPQNGMPSHSINFYISGGEESRIAELIFQLKPAGIETVGEILVNYQYNDMLHPIRFSRPSYTDIQVRVEVYTTPSWDSASVDLIKQAIVKVIGGVDYTTVPNVEYPSKITAGTLSAWDIYPSLRTIVGFADLDIEFSTDGVTWVKRIAVPGGTIPRTNTNDISVVET
jgi:uncharacterized phage protein gp47/JayE